MKKLAAFVIALAPTLLSAQTLNSIDDVAVRATRYGNLFLTLVISASVLFIVWNIFKYFIQEGEEQKKGAMNVMYGVIGLVLIFSIWGLVNLVRNSFQTNNNNVDVRGNIEQLLPRDLPSVTR